MAKFFEFDGERAGLLCAEEGFIADIQYDISRLMGSKGVSRADLARRLNVSKAYVTQLLGNGEGNLTARTIARIYFALGEEASVCCKRSLNRATASKVSFSGGWAGIAGCTKERWSLEPDGPQLDVANGEMLSSKETGDWLNAYIKAA